MGLTDSSSPLATLALLPRASPDARPGVANNFPLWTYLPARRPLLLPCRVRLEIDSRLPIPPFAGRRRRHLLSQTQDISHSGGIPPPLARADDRLLRISQRLSPESPRYQHPALHGSYRSADTHACAAASHDQ